MIIQKNNKGKSYVNEVEETPLKTLKDSKEEGIDSELLSTFKTLSTQSISTSEKIANNPIIITSTNSLTSTTSISSTTPIKETIQYITPVKCRITIEQNEYVVDENEILNLNCPKESNLIGLNVYKCLFNGEFTLINSTCIQTSTKLEHVNREDENWLEQLENDVNKNKMNFLLFAY